MHSFTVIIIIVVVVVIVIVVADAVRFKGLTTLVLKIQVFWNVMMC
jgi:hypothetical protein